MNRTALIPALLSAAVFTAATLPGLAVAGPVDVNINLNGYLPPPPGVHVYVDAGRPYYVQRGHRVYMERDRRHHRKHEREFRDHEDHGRHLGQMKHGRD